MTEERRKKDRTTIVHQWITILGVPAFLVVFGWGLSELAATYRKQTDLIDQLGERQQTVVADVKQLNRESQERGAQINMLWQEIVEIAGKVGAAVHSPPIAPPKAPEQ